MYTIPTRPIHATCTAHLNLVLIDLPIFSEPEKSRTYSIRHCLPPAGAKHPLLGLSHSVFLLKVVRGTTFAINTNNTYRQTLSYTNPQKSSTLIISAVNQCSAIINRLNLPINTAPAISNTVAKMQACLTVSTFDPTEVPNELATSLAPIPNAKTNAVRKPRTTSHSTSDEKGSSVNRLCGVVCTVSMVQFVWYKHSRFCLAHGTHPLTMSSVWRLGHPWLVVHKFSSVPQPFFFYI